MPLESKPQNDEELRRIVRAEIEQRERERTQQTQQREQARNAGVGADRRRQIYQEELRQYYSNRPGYREIIGEDGEPDWVPENELQKNEQLFDEALADPLEARRRLKFIMAAAAFFVVVLTTAFFFVLANKTGSISVSTNVPGAQIILDTLPLEYFTTTTIKELPEGEHVVSVQKAGYAIVGEPVQRITIRGGKTISLIFTLRPETEAKAANPDEELIPMKP